MSQHHTTASDDVVFLSHILSLKETALMEMGLIEGESQEPNLEVAAHIIDTLQVLLIKTKGNLSQDEVILLESSIKELKMNFIKLKK